MAMRAHTSVRLWCIDLELVMDLSNQITQIQFIWIWDINSNENFDLNLGLGFEYHRNYIVLSVISNNEYLINT